jgi:hypothetical protein
MKKSSLKFIATFCLGLLVLSSNAQSPQKMSYQAVIRNSSNTLVASTPVGMKISILQGTSTGTVSYSETQTPTTNINGLASFEIGSGTVVSGTLSAINWANGPYFIKTETDPTGGTAYSISSTTQLLSVPYALYAEKGGSPTLLSAFQPVGCMQLVAVTTTFQKVGNMGTFTKANANSFIELNIQTNLQVGTLTGAYGIIYEIRVDDIATTIGRNTAFLQQTGVSAMANFSGVFSGLAVGTHTVSMWAKTSNAGTASYAMYDSGCFNNSGTNNVLVKEFR